MRGRRAEGAQVPELPEVETVRRGLAPVMEGRGILAADVRRPDLRWPLPERMADRLAGQRVERLRRRSKYILADLSSGETLLIHLGMSGRMLVSGAMLGEFHHHTPRPRSTTTSCSTWRAARGSPSTTRAGSGRWTSSDREGGGALAAGRARARAARQRLRRGLPRRPPARAGTRRSRRRSSTSGSWRGLATSTSARPSTAPGSRPGARPGASPNRGCALWCRSSGRSCRGDRGGRIVAARLPAGGRGTGYFQHTFRVYDREGDPCVTPAVRDGQRGSSSPDGPPSSARLPEIA
jgi:formamidopyrimidine-DNA glycosylase